MARDTLPQNYVINSGTLFEDFESGWTRDNGADTVVCPSTDYFKTGSGSTKFTVGAGRTNGSFTKTINSVIDIGVSSMWVYIVDPAKLGSTGIVFYISSTADFSVYFTCSYPAASLHKGWNKLQFKKTKWSATGGESWANTMIRLRIRLYADGTNANTAYFDSFYIKEYYRPKLMIHFDDCFESAYDEGYAYMNAKGMKGTLFCINTSIGALNYMTLSELQTVYSNGWDIGVHGLTDLTTLENQAAMSADIATNKAYLVSNNLTRAIEHYAYPSGSYNDTAESAVSSNGIRTARTVQIRVQSVIPDEALRLNAVSITNATSLATANGYVDEAIASGGMYTLIFHQLVASSSGSNEWNIADFQALIDYIYSKNQQIDVVTISEWYNGLTNPRKTASSRTGA